MTKSSTVMLLLRHTSGTLLVSNGRTFASVRTRRSCVLRQFALVREKRSNDLPVWADIHVVFHVSLHMRRRPATRGFVVAMSHAHHTRVRTVVTMALVEHARGPATSPPSKCLIGWVV